MNKTVAIIVGFTEGDWHRLRLQTAFENHGYKVIDDPERADIIFAHSGGCYSVPLTLRPQQTVMLVDPTYWPGRPLAVRSQLMTWQLLRAIRPGNQPAYHIRKTFHNLVYLLWHGSQNLAMIRQAPHYNLEDELKHAHTILVRNQNDPWLTPAFRDLKHFNEQLQLFELEGDHDDCWLHPDTYINLLQSVAD